MEKYQLIIKNLESAGFRAAFLPFSAIEKISEHYNNLMLSAPNFAKSSAEHFSKNQPPDADFTPTSILVLVLHSPPASVRLTVGGKHFSIPIPPLYLDSDIIYSQIDAAFSSITENGFQTARPKGVSVKLLAALAELGKYGRNNIFYADTFGSHNLIAAVYTNIPYEKPFDFKLSFMDMCENCAICRQNCPTYAITDAPVIDADLCINKYTYRLDPIPNEIPKSAFNALIGCWHCQSHCPANASQAKPSANELTLDEAETRSFLAYESERPAELEAKLASFFNNKHLLSVAARNAALVLGLI
ncbi:MAG: hypothetical protein FWC95_06630 [Defluviitaleaceae bacterium]|nr:hypothetical protein [Defluviitaleaceae bacterium]